MGSGREERQVAATLLAETRCHLRATWVLIVEAMLLGSVPWVSWWSHVLVRGSLLGQRLVQRLGCYSRSGTESKSHKLYCQGEECL